MKNSKTFLNVTQLIFVLIFFSFPVFLCVFGMLLGHVHLVSLVGGEGMALFARILKIFVSIDRILRPNCRKLEQMHK